MYSALSLAMYGPIIIYLWHEIVDPMARNIILQHIYVCFYIQVTEKMLLDLGKYQPLIIYIS